MVLYKVCPKCGSKNFTKTPNGEWLCMVCGFKGKPVIPTPKMK